MDTQNRETIYHHTADSVLPYESKMQHLLDMQAPKILYEEGNEKIIKNGGTLGGYLNGCYFACTYLHPERELFFHESKTFEKLPISMPMKNDRIAVLFDTLFDRLSRKQELLPMIGQLEKVKKQWCDLRDQEEAFRQARAQSKRDKQMAELKAAAAQRKQNEERKKALRAQKQAQRAAEKEAARKKAQAAQEALKQKAEREKREKLLNQIESQQNIQPIFEYDKDGNKCFYMKLNGDLIHIVMSRSKPRCQVLTREPAQAKMLSPSEFISVVEQIDEHLNKENEFDSVLNEIGTFYQSFINKNCITTADKDVPTLYEQICAKLATPCPVSVIKTHTNKMKQKDPHTR